MVVIKWPKNTLKDSPSDIVDESVINFFVNWWYSARMFENWPFHEVLILCITPAESLCLLINWSICNQDICYLWVMSLHLCVHMPVCPYIYMFTHILFIRHSFWWQKLSLYFAFKVYKEAVSFRAVFLQLMKEIFFLNIQYVMDFQVVLSKLTSIHSYPTWLTEQVPPH